MQPRGDEPDTIARLFKAIETGDLEGARELLSADPSLATAKNKEGLSAILWATYYREPAICDLLLSRGVRPDVFESAALGRTERLEELLRADRGLVGRYSEDGWTPLHLAAHFGRLDAMKVLLSNGADHRVVSRNSNANQPLQAAAAGGQLAAVELLLKAGADVNHRSHGAFTALHIAASNGKVEMATTLLKAGADVNAATEGGKTALDFAIDGNHERVVDLLEGAGGRSGHAAGKAR